MKYERDPFARAQPPQHLQQRGAHLVVEGDPVGRIGFMRRGDVEDTGLVGVFMPNPGRSSLVQAEPPGDDRQPGADIVDL